MDPPKSGTTEESIKDTQPYSSSTPDPARSDDNLIAEQTESHTVEARVTRGKEATLNRDDGIEGYEHNMMRILDEKDMLKQALLDPAMKTKKDIGKRIDRYGDELECRVKRSSHFTNEINNRLIETEKQLNCAQREVEDMRSRFDEIMDALVQRNVFIADLKRHCNVENEQDVFKMILDGSEMALMRKRLKAAEKELKDMKSEPKNKEPEANGSLIQYSRQDFLSARDRKYYPAEETGVLRNNYNIDGWRYENSLRSGLNSRASKSTGSTDSEDDSRSESDTSSSSSDSEKEERKRKKKKKKEKKKGKNSENSKEKRRKEKQRRRLIEKLPLPDKYYGNKDGWSLFSEGFKTRYTDEDDALVRMILKETLRGEAQKEYRSLPKDIEKQGWRKCMKWLKERLFGGTRYTQVDYDRNLRNQILGNRRVADVCEEFTHWINKIYEGEGSRMEKVREEAKKRQLIVLFERTDQYRDLLKMVDMNAPFEEMRQHLERNEYAKKLERSCQNCGSNDHRTIECRARRDYSHLRCFKCNEMGHKAYACMEQMARSQSMEMVQSPVQNTGTRQINGQQSNQWDRNGNRGGYGRGNFSNGGRGLESDQKQWPRNGSNIVPHNQNDNGVVNQSPRVNTVRMNKIGDDFVKANVNVITMNGSSDNYGREVSNEICVTSQEEKSLFVKQIISESCTIGGVERKVISDTGSEISMIDMETWKEMKDKPMKRRTTRGIIGVQGKEIPVIGTCIANTKMSNGKTAKVGYYVSAINIQNPVIGGPALEALGYKLMTTEDDPFGKDSENRSKHVSVTDNAVQSRTEEIPHGISYDRDKQLPGCEDRNIYDEIIEVMRVKMDTTEDGANKVVNKALQVKKRVSNDREKLSGKSPRMGPDKTYRKCHKYGHQSKDYPEQWYNRYTLEDELPPGREMYI